MTGWGSYRGRRQTDRNDGTGKTCTSPTLSGLAWKSTAHIIRAFVQQDIIRLSTSFVRLQRSASFTILHYCLYLVAGPAHGSAMMHPRPRLWTMGRTALDKTAAEYRRAHDLFVFSGLRALLLLTSTVKCKQTASLELKAMEHSNDPRAMPTTDQMQLPCL
jgi:hypothetical protein